MTGDKKQQPVDFTIEVGRERDNLFLG